MEKKLIVFDIDGTLLNSKKEINSSLVKTINKIKSLGHYVILATGRAIGESTTKIVNELKLDNYIISVNGNFIYDIKNDKLYSHGKTLDHYVRHKFIEIAKKFKRQLIAYNNYGELRRYYFGINQETDIHDQDYFNNGVEVKEFNDSKNLEDFIFNENAPIVHLGFKAEKDIINQAIYELEDIKTKKLGHISVVGRVFIDVDSNNINKYSAIKQVSKLLNIENKNIIAFGDSYNDLEMLKNVGKGFLMGNAIDSLKEQFNKEQIIGDNNTDAISNVLIKELELEIQ